MRVQTSADYSTIEQISERLVEASSALGLMAERVAKAKQVKEYDSDRRKRALSVVVASRLSFGESATAAEHQARATEAYAEMMKTHAEQLASAETVIAEWDALKIKWETARSLLSVQKSLVANL